MYPPSPGLLHIRRKRPRPHLFATARVLSPCGLSSPHSCHAYPLQWTVRFARRIFRGNGSESPEQRPGFYLVQKHPSTLRNSLKARSAVAKQFRDPSKRQYPHRACGACHPTSSPTSDCSPRILAAARHRLRPRLRAGRNVRTWPCFGALRLYRKRARVFSLRGPA